MLSIVLYDQGFGVQCWYDPAALVACTFPTCPGPSFAMIQYFRRKSSECFTFDKKLCIFRTLDRKLRILPMPHMVQEPSSSIHKGKAPARPGAVSSNEFQRITRYHHQTLPLSTSSSPSFPSSSAFAPPSVPASHHRASYASSNLHFPVAAPLLLQLRWLSRLLRWVVLAVRQGHLSSMLSLPLVERQHHFPKVR